MAGAIASTGKTNYCTPEWIVEAVRNFYEGTIDLDPCSNANSLVNAISNFYHPDDTLTLEALAERPSRDPQEPLVRFSAQDGLDLSAWAYNRRVYINPPFGNKNITKWVQLAIKAKEEKNCEVILLIPDTPETKLWKNTILLKADGRCQLKKRVSFRFAKSSIPKAISIIYFGHNYVRFLEIFKHLGRVECPKEVYANQADIEL